MREVKNIYLCIFEWGIYLLKINVRKIEELNFIFIFKEYEKFFILLLLFWVFDVFRYGIVLVLRFYVCYFFILLCFCGKGKERKMRF